MSTDLENDVAAALRFRAGEVSDTPCPPLGAQNSTAPARRGWLIPVAAAVAVAGLGGAAVALTPSAPTGVDAGVDTTEPVAATEVYYSRTLSRGADSVIIEFELWQGQGRTDAWQRKGVGGHTIKDGRVVDDNSVQLDYATDGECYPAPTTTDALCTAPGSWFNPTPEFLADASRDPAVIAQQLRTEAGGNLGEADLTRVAFTQLQTVLEANGLPDDLEAALQDVVAELPAVEVTRDAANLLGERGTGYRLPGVAGTPLTIIFDADGDYLGSPDVAVVHGMAPGLGQPPSRLFD